MSILKIQTNLEASLAAVANGISNDFGTMINAISLEIKDGEAAKVDLLKMVDELKEITDADHSGLSSFLARQRLKAQELLDADYQSLVSFLDMRHQKINEALGMVVSHLNDHHNFRNAALRGLIDENHAMQPAAAAAAAAATEDPVIVFNPKPELSVVPPVNAHF